MFCTKCGKPIESNINFCGNCGNPMNSEKLTSSEMKEKSSKYIQSTKKAEDVLKEANLISSEYKTRKSLHKPLNSILNTGFAKERIAESLNQKAVVRFEGDAKYTSVLPREICFGESTVLFIVENSLLSRGTATALRKSEIQYIEVSRFESSFQLGMAQTNAQYWKLNFVTKWAGISESNPKNMFMAINDSTWNYQNGEISFYLPLGKSDHQRELFEEMYSEKLDTVAAFYPVTISEKIYTINRSIGLMFGTGFWREI